MKHLIWLPAVAALALLSCRDQQAPTELAGSDGPVASVASSQVAGHHLVVFAAEQVPSGFGELVAKLGGSVESSLDHIGVAAVTGLTENAAAELAAEPGIQNVEPDPITTMIDTGTEQDDASMEPTASDASESPDATASPASAPLYPRQWNLRAVSADIAWAKGHFGSRGVVVAILDTGLDYLHPDFVGLVDLQRSKSFVPEDDPIIAERFPGRLPISDLFWHGTAVASVVATNAKVLAGINREVTFLAVKIWNRFGKGKISQLVSGIVYAADQGADVMNVSGGYDFAKDSIDRRGAIAAVQRATNYAFRKGALLVSAPFNDAADLDHNRERVRLPCEAANAICASATAPTAAGGVNGPWTDVDAIAPYSAYGRSVIGVAAPGGVPAPFRRVYVSCTTTWTESTEPPACRLPACRLGQCVAQGRGTSLSVSHVVGLAALLVDQLGHGNPALIRARILESADDLGEPGTDPYYGRGRINIARALRLVE